MQPLDKQLQRRVWARVYGGGEPTLTPKQRETLRRCLARSRENLAFYEKMQAHRLYAAAFTRLTAETKEQIKMLQQMLR